MVVWRWPSPGRLPVAGRDFFMLTKEELSQLSDEELSSLLASLESEAMAREKKKSTSRKAAAAKANKRDPRCPDCHCRLRKDGKRGDGSQRYECPICGRHSCDTTATSLASSKLPLGTIRKMITLIMLDCPDWVVSYILGVGEKTAQFWKDRCLDAAAEWSKESTLSGHVWIDEMRFAPTRASGFVDGVWTTYAGRIAKDAYMEIAFDAKGGGFCKLYSEKLGMPTRRMVAGALADRIAKGSKLTRDGAPAHNLLVKRLALDEEWCKFVPGDREYEAKMKLMSNCCSYLRHSFESHVGIKFSKLEAYGNFFLYRWAHVRKCGLKDTISFMVSRVYGTPKSHKYRNSFRKTSMWL